MFPLGLGEIQLGPMEGLVSLRSSKFVADYTKGFQNAASTKHFHLAREKHLLKMKRCEEQRQLLSITEQSAH